MSQAQAHKTFQTRWMLFDFKVIFLPLNRKTSWMIPDTHMKKMCSSVFKTSKRTNETISANNNNNNKWKKEKLAVVPIILCLKNPFGKFKSVFHWWIIFLTANSSSENSETTLPSIPCGLIKTILFYLVNMIFKFPMETIMKTDNKNDNIIQYMFVLIKK